MIIVASLYQFTRFTDPESHRDALEATCRAGEVKGTLLLAAEGINGTIAGSRAGVDAVLADVRALPGCGGLDVKESTAQKMPFLRLKVRVKPEIVTLGQPGVDPLAAVGAYVAPAAWNDLISAPDVAVIDTRNDYEVGIGSFSGAVNPRTASFRDFPAWWQENRHAFAGKRVAMFCTGGIRCEKATNYLLGEGVTDVFHLKGGILKYLEQVPAEDSLWQGECFVFDGRVSVGHGLVQGRYTLCHACRRPLAPEAMAAPGFEAGVSCPACVDETSAAQKAAFREREKQIALAKAAGRPHIGEDAMAPSAGDPE